MKQPVGKRGIPYVAAATLRDRVSGLGLAMAGRIMRGHCGSAGIHSAPGRGTRVELFLPHANEDGLDLAVVEEPS